MTYQTVLITGANSGIGKAAAIKFASEGYTVIMACRSLTRSQKAYQEVIDQSGSNQVDLMELDISSFKSIQAFHHKFKSKYETLDILIHNAASFNHGEKNYQESNDGLELTFATNVVGPFLLSHLLLPQLTRSEYPKIFNACSNIIKHFFDPRKAIDFDYLLSENKHSKKYSVYQQYCESKMALLILTLKMAEQFQPLGINVNALQINGAKMSRDTIKKFKSYWKIFAHIQNLFFPPPEVMANLYFSICTKEAFHNKTGALFNHKQEVIRPSPYQGYPGPVKQIEQVATARYYPVYATNPEVQEKLWTICSKHTKAYLGQQSDSIEKINNFHSVL